MRDNQTTKKLKVFIASACFTLLFSVSCKKEETVYVQPETVTTEITDGLPPNAASINGYFYASYHLQSSFSSTGYYLAEAQFGDPARNLMSNFDHLNDVSQFNQAQNDRPNVQVNDVKFNNEMLIQSNSGFSPYQLINSGMQQEFNASTAWTIEGNKSFVAFQKQVPRGFPVLQTSVQSYTAFLRDGDFILNGPATAVNYDSLVVAMVFGAGSFRAGVLKGNNVVIPKSVLQKISYSTILKIKAFNYSHFTLNNKVYVFENSHENSVILQVQP